MNDLFFVEVDRENQATGATEGLICGGRAVGGKAVVNPDAHDPALESAKAEFAEFYRLADLMESGLLNALLLLQGALNSLLPTRPPHEDDPPIDDEHWSEIGEDYERLCALLLQGETFKRLHDSDKARLRLKLGV